MEIVIKTIRESFETKATAGETFEDAIEACVEGVKFTASQEGRMFWADASNSHTVEFFTDNFSATRPAKAAWTREGAFVETYYHAAHRIDGAVTFKPAAETAHTTSEEPQVWRPGQRHDIEAHFKVEKYSVERGGRRRWRVEAEISWETRARQEEEGDDE